jgi:hypothetical protein
VNINPSYTEMKKKNILKFIISVSLLNCQIQKNMYSELSSDKNRQAPTLFSFIFMVCKICSLNLIQPWIYFKFADYINVIKMNRNFDMLV